MKKFIVGTLMVGAGIAAGIALVKTGALDLVVEKATELKDSILNAGEDVVDVAGEAVAEAVEDVATETI